MEERQIQNLKQSTFQDVIKQFNNLDDDDIRKMALCLNTLLYRTGSVDGTYEAEAELYRFAMLHLEDINRYLYFIGLQLLSDTITKQAWIAPAVIDDGGLFSAFPVKDMNGSQMILLAVLQKRLASGTSSDDTGADSFTGILLTEADIMKDMFPYITGNEDEKTKRAIAMAAINKFVDPLGLLRVVSKNLLLSDGTYSTVYRVNPFIQHQFDIVEMDKLMNALCEQAESNNEEIKEDERDDSEDKNEDLNADKEETALFVGESTETVEKE